MSTNTDWQRSRVYRAEHVSVVAPNEERIEWDPEVVRHDANAMLELVSSVYGTPRRICSTVKTIGLNERRLGWAYYGGGQMALQPKVHPIVMMHEVAHLAVSSDHVPSHGIEFADVFHFIVKEFWNSDRARVLRSRFDLCGVQYSHSQRDDYTRKRARWAVGPNGDHWIDLVQRIEVNPEQTVIRSRRMERTPHGILVRDTAVAGAGPGVRADVLIPYDHIAYIWRTA